MRDKIIEAVYESVVGQVLDELSVPFAENLFEPGKKCDDLYLQSREAYARVCKRLHPSIGSCAVTTEDRDLDSMADSLEQICRLVGYEMFRCGAYFQKHFNSDSV